LIEQEVSSERWLDIPSEVLDVFSLWRHTPLFRAHRLEKALGTPAKIYYKYEGVSPAGSHKPNTAVAQAYYNKEAGITRLSTETGAGQWGSSLALAGQFFGIEVRVYMVKVSFHQKPYRRSMMQTWGAEVFESPSDMTEAGRQARDAGLLVVVRLRDRRVGLVGARRAPTFVLVVDVRRCPELRLESVRAIQGRRAPQLEDLADRLGDRNPALSAHLLLEQCGREDDAEGLGAERLPIEPDRRKRRVRHVGDDVVPGLGDVRLGEEEFRCAHLVRSRC